MHILFFGILDFRQIYYEQNVVMYRIILICSSVLRECNFDLFSLSRGTQWRSGLKHCATALQAGSIPVGVIGIFIDKIFPALGMTQPATEMSTRNISWGIKAAVA
jgi:hypothetical protein